MRALIIAVFLAQAPTPAPVVVRLPAPVNLRLAGPAVVSVAALPGGGFSATFDVPMDPKTLTDKTITLAPMAK